MNQLKKQISQKEATTSKPLKNLLAFNGFTSLKKLLKGFLLLSLILIASLVVSALIEIPTHASSSPENVSAVAQGMMIDNVRKVSTERLIKEVDIYIKSIAPTTKLKAEVIVDQCERYNIDIIFVIAQGILESHLGTKGMAITTNSVWNVGTYDDGKIHYSYKDPNESLEPYLKLIKKVYLVRVSQSGDTIHRGLQNLIQDRGFVNIEGKRYATSTSYENMLRNMIIKVSMESSINLYQGIANLSNTDIISFFSIGSQAKDSLNLAKL
jgi:flagellum-specific peptidoglycan hydrolase FlgJ